MKINKKKQKEILKLFKSNNNKDFRDGIINTIIKLSVNDNNILVDNKELFNNIKEG